jgi:hypothetical protein
MRQLAVGTRLTLRQGANGPGLWLADQQLARLSQAGATRVRDRLRNPEYDFVVTARVLWRREDDPNPERRARLCQDEWWVPVGYVVI